jgi:hypothetical protein
MKKVPKTIGIEDWENSKEMNIKYIFTFFIFDSNEYKRTFVA